MVKTSPAQTINGEIMKTSKIILSFFLFLSLLAFAVASSGIAAMAHGELKQAISIDGEIISYTSYGKGEITLVFIHGWLCDSRYWREQISYFSNEYHVVTIDLAGHGHSSFSRKVYSLDLFGEDVKAVVNKIDSKRIILIGHSMGGTVIAKAAALMPKRVIGLIGIDTLQNIESEMKPEEIKNILQAYTKDFRATLRPFVEGMIVEGTDPALKEWIVNDMSSAPPKAGISAFKEYVTSFNHGGVAKVFKGINTPVRCVNTDLWPTDLEANRKHMKYFDATILKGSGHFLML
jgi:pimeloyl-ACP methyl ester carboxylesterase